MLLEHGLPARIHLAPQRIEKVFEFSLVGFGFVATLDLQGFEFCFVGLTEFVDFDAVGIGAGEGGLDVGEVVEFD